MTYATTTDIAKRLGRPASSDSETEQWEAWLEDVEALILGRLPSLPDRVSNGRPTEATVVMVEANAVIRKINNPTGKRSERIDDYYYELSSDQTGTLGLTDEEWALLSPGSPDGAFTIRPFSEQRGRGEWLHPDVWVPLP